MPVFQDVVDTKHWIIDRIIAKFTPRSTKLQMIPTYPPFNPPLSQDELNGLAAAFGRVHVSNPPTQNCEPGSPAAFVGGFNLPGISSDSKRNVSLDSQTVTMPEPQQSLTMTYALQLDGNRSTASAQSPPVTPQKPARRRAQSRSSSTVASPSPVKASSISATPAKASLSTGGSPNRKSSPSRQTDVVQCSGITKVQERCTRMIKINYPLDGASDKIERFCYQHTKEVLKPTGYYACQNTIWVDFDDWIPAYLEESTQASLRAEMEKAKSAQDEPGYIYTFEIRDPGSKTIRLKVGRASNVVKRLDQWTKQCSSKEQVARGVYPANGDQDGSLMKGRIQAGEKSPFCHRLERLIHIELADLASTRVYLKPGWPNIETPSSISASPKKKTNGKEILCNKPCPDCGSRHQEIFEFWRWEEGVYQGKEWERIVKPVIERWGKFVELYV